MAITASYKDPSSIRARVITTEDKFNKGMSYVNTTQDDGYVKSMVNYILRNDGTVLAPRGGLTYNKKEVSKIERIIDSPTADKHIIIHHSDSMLVLLHDESDSILCDYTLVGELTEDLKSIKLSTSTLILDVNGTYLTATPEHSSDVKAITLRKGLESIHGVDIIDGLNAVGVYASLESNTYLPLIINGSTTVGTIRAKLNETLTEVTWDIVPLDAKEIQPTQAINYGYNMLKEDPYHFENAATATGGVVLTGILPYSDDAAGALKLTARPGESIVFELFYKYPTSTTDKYMVQWEIQDLDSNTTANTIQQVRKSPVYNPGDRITLTYSPTYKAFSLIAKIYLKSKVDALPYQDDITDYNKLSPEQVLPLASYYLTSDSNSTMLNVSAVNYDLGTATGMCSWQQRIVLWGVKNAKNTLFVSEINNPEYVPYPNNSEIFPNDIVCAVPYLTQLLVFTKSALYLITLGEDGLSYTTKCVQERLNMTPEDASTVITVQNMVYFKSGNHFFMIVPNNTSLTNTLQLAPVSRPVEDFLDNFKVNARKLINDVYNIDNINYGEDWTIDICDFNVYLDDNQVRNAYKIKVTTTQPNLDKVVHYMDLSLNYDTVLRAWTSFVWEANKYRLQLYKATVTGKSLYGHVDSWVETITEIDEETQIPVITHKQHYSISYVYMDEDYPKDKLLINNSDVRMFPNYQFIDTGYRQHAEINKKRFREIQFGVNVLNNDELNFYTAFVVDDDMRKDIYKYNTVHITDPDDPNYGIVYVERVLSDIINTSKSVTELDGAWKLDSSQFPDITLSKVRFKVSGKGYGGSIRLLSTNEVQFELTYISWVYRVMYAR